MPKSYTVLFGLTADPIHKGHEQAIIAGIEFLRAKNFVVEQFYLVPVFSPNLIAHKKAPVASFEQRFAMCKIVAKRISHELSCSIEVSAIEKQLFETTGEKSYSVDTIKKFNLPNCLFMVSADHFAGRWPKFRSWYKWQDILNYTGLLINQRPGHKINHRFLQQLNAINPNTFVVNSTKAIEVSSSSIRKDLDFYSSKDLLSDDVAQYTNTMGIYR